jgi:hypothetical protein
MKTPMNGNGHNVRSQANEHLIYLSDGRSIGFEDATRKTARRIGSEPRWPATQPLHREVQFALLADGGLVDLVRGRLGNLDLVVYRDGAASTQGRVQDGGAVLVPPSVDYSVLQAVCCPKSVGACEAPQALLSEIREFVEHYLEIGEAESKLVAYFALCTWLNACTRSHPTFGSLVPTQAAKPRCSMRWVQFVVARF